MAGEYCQVSDLLVGNLPTSSLNPQLYVTQAAEEIDTRLGFKYQTPFDISQSSALVRPAVLLLKKINVHLATGRLILGAYNAIEDVQLNSYGKSLVDDAEAALDMIYNGIIVLTGATDINGNTVGPGGITNEPSAPLIADVDLSDSGFGAFYGKLMGGCVNSYGVTFSE